MYTVYRVENTVNGHGPFDGEWRDSQNMDAALLEIDDNFLQRHNTHMLPPFFDSKLERIFNREYFCAYKSIEDLLFYMGKESLALLIDHNCRILKLTVKLAHYGEEQVIFRKLDNIVETKDLTDDIWNIIPKTLCSTL